MTIAEAVRVVVDESARKDERIAHLEREVARLESWICDMQIRSGPIARHGSRGDDG
jgi:hypothetical protein